MGEVEIGIEVLTVLANLKNGKIDDAVAHFAEEFALKDHGIGLEFKEKERLAEFFHKTRELYPDSFLPTGASRLDKVHRTSDRIQPH